MKLLAEWSVNETNCKKLIYLYSNKLRLLWICSSFVVKNVCSTSTASVLKTNSVYRKAWTQSFQNSTINICKIWIFRVKLLVGGVFILMLLWKYNWINISAAAFFLLLHFTLKWKLAVQLRDNILVFRITVIKAVCFTNY